MLVNHKQFLSKLFAVLIGGAAESNRHRSNSLLIFYMEALALGWGEILFMLES